MFRHAEMQNYLHFVTSVLCHKRWPSDHSLQPMVGHFPLLSWCRTNYEGAAVSKVNHGSGTHGCMEGGRTERRNDCFCLPSPLPEPCWSSLYVGLWDLRLLPTKHTHVLIPDVRNEGCGIGHHPTSLVPWADPGSCQCCNWIPNNRWPHQ